MKKRVGVLVAFALLVATTVVVSTLTKQEIAPGVDFDKTEQTGEWFV